jgi:hypothetical protein
VQGDSIINMTEHLDSKQFFIGIKNLTIDLMDNPYVKVAAYILKDHKLDNPVRLK